ncbi:unnamed protein product [Anisakis simplex]|uniref:EKC/KEOPS complex subunit TPRKB (inferred by orthology to a human protein) n=1 Tax=Anisakis simplex TaxID=6269 RepID=A0A0M3KI35_ANISI|nr:unnamed protein product [Anisakis simplex]
MKLGLSRLYELQPDPYDCSQKNNLRVCLFADVKNSAELRDGLRGGRFEAALVRPELILETFIVLAAANRALHQAAHNRLSTRSLHAELIYSLSPNRNVIYFYYILLFLLFLLFIIIIYIIYYL